MKNLILMCLVGLASTVIAQDSKPCNCCSEEYRQFDFWIGDWEVRDSAGTLLGTNLITLIEDSCALRENWTGAKGSTGTSLSFYIKSSDSWHQTWVDKWGGSILMDGKQEGKSIVMFTAKKPTKDKKSFVQNKTSWTPLEDGRVHHVWEQTQDDGKSWNVVFNGYYKKK